MLQDETGYLPESDREFASKVINFAAKFPDTRIGDLIITKLTDAGLRVWLSKDLIDKYVRSMVFAVPPNELPDFLIANAKKDT